MFNVAIIIVQSRLESSGLFVDSAFPHATAWAEEAEAADDVQLFRSPDSRVQRSSVGYRRRQASSNNTTTF